jgi:hypothetical protein
VLLVRQGMVMPEPDLRDFYLHQKPVYSVKVRDTLLVGVYFQNSREIAP